MASKADKRIKNPSTHELSAHARSWRWQSCRGSCKNRKVPKPLSAWYLYGTWKPMTNLWTSSDVSLTCLQKLRSCCLSSALSFWHSCFLEMKWCLTRQCNSRWSLKDMHLWQMQRLIRVSRCQAITLMSLKSASRWPWGLNWRIIQEAC